MRKKLSVFITVMFLACIAAGCGKSALTAAFYTPSDRRRPAVIVKEAVDYYAENPDIGYGKVKQFTTLLYETYETYNTSNAPFGSLRNDLNGLEIKGNSTPGRPYYYHNTSSAFAIQALIVQNDIDSALGKSLVLMAGQLTGDMLNWRLAYPLPTVIRYDFDVAFNGCVQGNILYARLSHGDPDKSTAGQNSSFIMFKTDADGKIDVMLSESDPTVLFTGLSQDKMYHFTLMVRPGIYDVYMDGNKINTEPLPYYSFLEDKALATFSFLTHGKAGYSYYLDNIMIASTTDTKGRLFDIDADNAGDGFIQAEVIPALETAIPDAVVEFTLTDKDISDYTFKDRG
jgi:hypothetical protein